MLKESKLNAETIKPAPLVLKTNPSNLRPGTLNGPKLPSYKLDLKIPPVGSIAQSKQHSFLNAPRPAPNLAHRSTIIPNPTTVISHPATTTPHPSKITPHPSTTTPHPAATHSYSPQRKFAATQPTEQSYKVHPTESPTRPPILSQPRSLFYTGNLPVPIHARSVLEQPNPLVNEHHCRSASSTHSVPVNADSRHGKIHNGRKTDGSKTEGNVQDKVGKLDKGLPQSFLRGAMFTQLPRQANLQVEEEKGNKCATSVAQNFNTIPSEVTPLLGLKDSPILTSAKSTSPWKETKDIMKVQKRQLAKERRKAASSSKTISEPAAVTPQLPSPDTITLQAATPVKIITKEAIKEQRKRDKEERKAESLRRREESLKKKAEKKLKRHGLGAVIAAGDEDESGSYDIPTTDLATTKSLNSASLTEADTGASFIGGKDGSIEASIDFQNPIRSEVENTDVTITTPAQFAADSLYPQRNRRHDSKSEPGGLSVSLDLDLASSQGSEATTVVIHGDGADGESKGSTGRLIRFPQVREGSVVGIANVGERKGILKNVAQAKRRVSAPARESTAFDGQKRRERVPTPMAMVGGLIGPGLGGLGVGIPVMPEMERMGPPVSMNTQVAHAENGTNAGRRSYMGGGLMRGKRRQWRIRSRAAGSTSAQGDGGLNDGANMGMDGAGAPEGGIEVGEGSGTGTGKGKGKGKGKGRGSVRFVDEA